MGKKIQTHDIPFNPDLTFIPSETDKSGNVISSNINEYKLNFGSVYYGNVALKKYNSAGENLFVKIFYGKIASDFIQTDAYENIYLSGTFMDTLKIDSLNFIYNTGSGLNLNYFILKLSPSGQFIWKKIINMIYSGNFALQELKVKGEFLFTGMKNNNNAYIKKFDLNGNELMNITQQNVFFYQQYRYR